MNIPQIKKAIRNGDFDNELDRLQNTVNHLIRVRRHEISQALADDFALGQRVRTLPGNYKPRYFFNLEGRVTKIEAPWVWIELDEPVERGGRGGGKIIKHVGIAAINVEPIDE